MKQSTTTVWRATQYFHVEKSSNTSLTSMFYLFLPTTFTLSLLLREMSRLSLQPCYSQCQPTRCISKGRWDIDLKILISPILYVHLQNEDKVISVTCTAPSSVACNHICNPKEKLCAKCIFSEDLLVSSPQKRDHGLPRNPSITQQLTCLVHLSCWYQVVGRLLHVGTQYELDTKVNCDIFLSHCKCEFNELFYMVEF